MSTAYDFDGRTSTDTPRARPGRTITMPLSQMPRTGVELYIEQLSAAVAAGQDDEVAVKVIEWMADRAITPSADWSAYLRSLEGTRFPVGQVAHVRKVISALAASAGGRLPPPQAGPGDEGALMLVWDAAGSHLEIEVFVDGRWEWFHSTSGAFEGNDVPTGAAVPAELAAVLPRFLAR